MVTGGAGSCKNDGVITRVPKSLIEDITSYAAGRYGGKVKFTEAARLYVADHRRLRQNINSKGGNNFL